jgi:hypothetical protein
VLSQPTNRNRREFISTKGSSDEGYFDNPNTSLSPVSANNENRDNPYICKLYNSVEVEKAKRQPEGYLGEAEHEEWTEVRV